VTEPETPDAPVVFEDVDMDFDGRPVLRRMSCRFPRGKISVLLGGSGSGKTTILRLIGGLIRPRRGRVLVEGRDVTCLAERELYSVREKIGMMFQGGALLNSLTVFDNLAFPLHEHSALTAAQIADEVHKQLTAVGLSDVDALLPGQLSGGMLRRAALARAILTRPQILLCDEPFSGLDPISVKRIEALLVQVNRTLGVTLLVSSHHIPSTMRMADQVVLLRLDGIVSGSPAELQQSADPWISEFLNEQVGAENLERIEDPRLREAIGPGWGA